METLNIKTSIGEISVKMHIRKGTVPIVFLHGVYFDSTMWYYQAKRITDRTVITIDMPYHGSSRNITKKNWTLDDCAIMLIEILNSMKIDKVIAVGHSWGSMTILRAAHKSPHRFLAIGLCNMPYKEPTKKEILSIKFQHLAVFFRNIYMKQAGKSLFGKASISSDPNLIDKLIVPMSNLTNKEIKYTDKSVRIEAKDSTPLITSLSIPVFALIGESDYVGIPPIKETTIVKGGHVSPLEEPEEVFNFIKRIFQNISKHKN